ncbi:MAG: hypothetical protein IPO24_00215 [Bacteroidetes bacterium]|nr:hypothetical protein [Bacteroidota bacterium]
MKKLILPILTVLYAVHVNGQAVTPCDEPVKAIDVISAIPINHIPTNFTDDIWGVPELIIDRNVYFIHGLGGQGDEDGTVGISWSQASLWSEQEYYINSHRPDYADISLDFAAAELKSDLEGFGAPDVHSFLIAHSQGGIVSRRLDQYYVTGELGLEPRTFGGLVTFGSPHQGAMILNNRDDLVEWSGNSCEALSAGPLVEEVESSFFLDLLLSSTDIDAFQTSVCNYLENGIVPFVFKDYYAGITESYKVGSEQINALNDFVPEIPYVCFYGEETEPILWHTLTHVFPGHEPNNTVTYGLEPFGAGGDNTLVEYADAMTNKYYTKYYAYDYLADMYSELVYGVDLTTIFCYMSILCATSATNSMNECREISDAYKIGYDWFSEANKTWQGIIGAGSLVESSNTCYCMDWGPLGDVNPDEYEVGPGEDCATEDVDTDCTSWTSYIWEVKASDGVVLVESASECNGQVSGLITRSMPGSNHFAMRNDENIEIKLIELYDGLHGEYFSTPSR